jgi:GT2 family glycosyltransferase/glycosyltransferase involved in cell wall biosynthesis
MSADRPEKDGEVGRDGGSAGRVAGLNGRLLLVVLEKPAFPARVTLSEADEVLASLVVEAPANEAADDLTHDLALPRFLYDGRVHALRVTCNGAMLENGLIHFAGDPGIVAPAPLRQAAEPPVSAATRAATTESALAALVQGLQAQSEALTRVVRGGQGPAGDAVVGPAASLSQRYGPLVRDAALHRGSGPDIMWFGIIDWHFRIQRPQHLAMKLADLGSRVFYISIVFRPVDGNGRFLVIGMPHPGVYEIRLKIAGDVPKNIYGGFSDGQVSEIQASLDEAMDLLGIHEPRAVVQFPGWHRVAIGLPGTALVYDCLDHIGGFSGVGQAVIDEERDLVAEADLVVTSSAALERTMAATRPVVVVRNGADVEVFAAGVNTTPTGRPQGSPGGAIVVGYFGALAEWFEIGWVIECARRHPAWRFELVGQVSGFDPGDARSLANIVLHGEKPYRDLPDLLAGWDVAIIPFKLTDLILSTNPVKLYEYMAGGKPVVASPMPEVVAATDMVYIAATVEDFEAQIAKAHAEDGPERRTARRQWAAAHDWSHRALAFRAALDQMNPKVSIVILAYNNWVLTRGCIESVLQWSDYDNLEVILVDNASSDETRRHLDLLGRRDPRLKVIASDVNRGFAGGNNLGIRAATGDYVILLNNDTRVTRGWVRDLIRPMMLDSRIGMTGPLTNNMGNEQKVKIAYENIPHMHEAATALGRRFSRRRLKVRTLAFFCVAIARPVLDAVGVLDEDYGLGYFEDDDYCRRVEKAGFDMVIADDVFVHHELSASFNALGAEEKRRQMERNKALYEQKWGPWIPHRYRADPDFG